MSEITLRCASVGDLEVSALVLRSSLRGNWLATVTCYAPARPLDGEAITLRFATAAGTEDVWTGAVRRSRDLAEATQISVTLVGGAGLLLSPPLAPRYHTAGSQTVPAGLVAAGIAADAGERLAAGVEAALDAYPLTSWLRMGGTARDAVDTLAGVLALGWRVLMDGTLWIGVETWDEPDNATLDRAYFESGDPADGTVYYGCDGTPFQAGQSINGAQAVEVCYRYDAMQPDRSAGALRAEVRTALPGDPVYAPDLTLYRQPYAGTVQAESTDGRLDIAADDPRVGDGLRAVPARTSWPGCKVTIPEGTRVRIQFESGLPTGCFALSSIDQDAGAELAFALLNDTVKCGTLTGTDSTKAAVQFVWTPQSGPVQTGPSVTIEGIVFGPGHKYAKGRPA